MSIVCVCHISVIHAAMDGHLHRFHLLGTLERAAIAMDVQVSLGHGIESLRMGLEWPSWTI